MKDRKTPEAAGPYSSLLEINNAPLGRRSRTMGAGVLGWVISCYTGDGIRPSRSRAAMGTQQEPLSQSI